MQDNHLLILDLLDFSNPDHFYFVQILKRRKDNPNMEKDMSPIASEYIKSSGYFLEIWPTLKSLADSTNARVYIRMNPCSFKRNAFETLSAIAKRISEEEYSSIHTVYESVCGKFQDNSNKKWIVDIDYKEAGEMSFENISKYCSKVLNYVENAIKETGREPNMKLVPTKNGLHILCNPFRLDKFKNDWPKIDIHKSATTLIYCP